MENAWSLCFVSFSNSTRRDPSSATYSLHSTPDGPSLRVAFQRSSCFGVALPFSLRWLAGTQLRLEPTVAEDAATGQEEEVAAEVAGAAGGTASGATTTEQ